jgi:hypothetical protein
MGDHYQEMAECRFKKEGHHAFAIEGWYEMFPQDRSPFRRDKSPKDTGWKFHLSVHPGDVRDAWNIAVDEMLNISDIPHHAKAAMPETADKHSIPESSQSGKMIVIYTGIDIGADIYQDLLQRIEHKLRAAGIRPGADIKGDNKVPGSAYMAYRNDRLAGEYNRAANNAAVTAARRYNPAGEDDPYENFKIEPLWQVASWPWKGAKTKNGPITRIKVEDREEAQEKIRVLKNLGMKAVMATSDELGLTVRLEGSEMEPVERARKGLRQVAQWSWLEEKTKNGMPIMRVKVNGAAKQQETIGLLQSLGMIALKHTSNTLGLTVRIQGAEMAQIKKQQEITQAHMHRSGKPRPSGGP